MNKRMTTYHYADRQSLCRPLLVGIYPALPSGAGQFNINYQQKKEFVYPVIGYPLVIKHGSGKSPMNGGF